MFKNKSRLLILFTHLHNKFLQILLDCAWTPHNRLLIYGLPIQIVFLHRFEHFYSLETKSIGDKHFEHLLKKLNFTFFIWDSFPICCFFDRDSQLLNHKANESPMINFQEINVLRPVYEIAVYLLVKSYPLYFKQIPVCMFLKNLCKLFF